MDAAGREMQVRTFVEEAWNGRNYQAVSDLYADTYADGCLWTPAVRFWERNGSGHLPSSAVQAQLPSPIARRCPALTPASRPLIEAVALARRAQAPGQAGSGRSCGLWAPVPARAARGTARPVAGAA